MKLTIIHIPSSDISCVTRILTKPSFRRKKKEDWIRAFYTFNLFRSVLLNILRCKHDIGGDKENIINATALYTAWKQKFQHISCRRQRSVFLCTQLTYANISYTYMTRRSISKIIKYIPAALYMLKSSMC